MSKPMKLFTDEDGDCPICLDSLPPFWKFDDTVRLTCCGKLICNGCKDRMNSHVWSAIAYGKVGPEERQLGLHCPLCRAEFGDTITELKQRIDEGSLWAKYDLSCAYRSGLHGLQRDEPLAVDLMLEAAEEGYPEAQFTLGNCYRNAECSVYKSDEDARYWYTLAAKQGHAIAEHNLALMYEEECNFEEFIRLEKMSASKDYCLALLSLGGAHHLGTYCAFGLEQSVAKAVTLLKRGAAQGHPKCMGYLGYLLCNPEKGTPPHSNKAFSHGLRWARKAASTGDLEAKTHLENIECQASSKCFNCVQNLAKLGKSFRCTQCRAAWYCSKQCQIQDWQNHKKCCVKHDI